VLRVCLVAIALAACIVEDSPPPEEDDKPYWWEQRTACCECLDRTTRYGSNDSCLSVSVATCQEWQISLNTQCYCWERCYSSCSGTGYPYGEPPNGCQH
jgi:hypothetical protein